MADRQIQLIITALDQTKVAFQDVGNNLKKVESTSKVTAERLKEHWKTAAAAITGALVGITGGITGIAYSVVRVNSEFENFSIQLETVLGSSKRAQEALKWIEAFTMKTPFELKQVTEAFVLLQGVGIDATKALGGIGDAAASMNRTLIEATTAVISMEREVLRRYGIDFRMAADGATFVWRNKTGEMVKTTAKGGQAVIRETLLSIWNERYEGGMKRFQTTMTGMWSNVKDNATKFIRMIGEAGVFDKIKEQIESILKAFNEFLETGRAKEWAIQISNVVMTTWNALETLGRAIYAVIKLLVEYKDIVIAVAAAKVSHLIATTLSAITVVGRLGWAIKNLGFVIKYFAVVTLPALLTPLGLVSIAIGGITYAYLKLRGAKDEAKRATDLYKLSLQGMNKELLQSELHLIENALAQARLRKEEAAAMPHPIFRVPMTELHRARIERAPEWFVPLTGAEKKYKEAVIEERKLLEQQKAIREKLLVVKETDVRMTDMQTSAMKEQADSAKRLADQWAKIKDRLKLDIAKAGETEYMQKMIDLMWKVSELRKKYGDKPIIQQWFDVEKAKIEQAEIKRLEQETKRIEKERLAETERKRQEVERIGAGKRAEAEKVREFERELTIALAEEHEKRLLDVKEWERRKLETLDELAKENIDIHRNYKALRAEIITTAGKKEKMIVEENERAKQELMVRFQRAQLEGLIAAGVITREEGYKREIELINQLSSYYEELRDRQVVGSVEWLKYSTELEGMYKRIYELQILLKEQTGTLTEGLVEGIRRYIDGLNTEFQKGLAIVQQVTQSMENAFMNFFDKTSEGFMNFGKLAMSILNDIYRALIRTLIVQPLVGAITKGIGGLFGGGRRLSPGTIIGDFIPVAHSGGLVIQYGVVPKFHWGGLANDEVPAILQRGEYVVSRRGVAALDAINQGRVSSAKPDVNVVVNVQNQTGLPVDAMQDSVRFDGENYIVNMIMKNIDGYGPLRHVIAGVR